MRSLSKYAGMSSFEEVRRKFSSELRVSSVEPIRRRRSARLKGTDFLCEHDAWKNKVMTLMFVCRFRVGTCIYASVASQKDIGTKERNVTG